VIRQRAYRGPGPRPAPRAGRGAVRGVLVMGLAAIWALAAACAVLGGLLLGLAVCWRAQDRADRDPYARVASLPRRRSVPPGHLVASGRHADGPPWGPWSGSGFPG
jgi:hypothetical protein